MPKKSKPGGFKFRKRGFAPPWHGSGKAPRKKNMVDPDKALKVALEARDLNDALAPYRDEFADSIIKYFRRHGSVTTKQYQALVNWIAKAKARAVFDGRAVAPKEVDRFQDLLEVREDD